MKIMKIYHVTKSCLQLCAALMITTDMGLALDLSLIPKVCYSCPLSKSDVRIQSTSRLKHAFAPNMFAPSGPAFPLVPLLLFERTTPLDPSLNDPTYTHGCGINTHPPATGEMETSPARVIFKRSEQCFSDYRAHLFGASYELDKQGRNKSTTRETCGGTLHEKPTGNIPMRPR